MVDQFPWVQRRSTRHAAIDYRAGMFFITICTYERRRIFGEIVDGQMQRHQMGTIVETCWQLIPTHFQHVQLDVWGLMPDHVHGILHLTATNSARPVLGTIVGSFKSAVSKRSNSIPNVPQTIWQRGYHDRQIRDESDLVRVRDYIHQNPFRWHDDHTPSP